jgi:hypothetical protein
MVHAQASPRLIEERDTSRQSCKAPSAGYGQGDGVRQPPDDFPIGKKLLDLIGIGQFEPAESETFGLAPGDHEQMMPTLYA